MHIRKVSIGLDYKAGSMHYILGQSVLGETNKIHLIKYDEQRQSVKIYIINEKQEIVLWKELTSTVPITIEYNINF